jgi:hypothetical protein
VRQNSASNHGVRIYPDRILLHAVAVTSSRRSLEFLRARGDQRQDGRSLLRRTPRPGYCAGPGAPLLASCYWSSASSPLGAFANMAPILLFAVSPEDQRSRQGVFALRANLPATICTSTRLLSLIKSACTRGKSCQYHTANIIIRLNLYDERAPTSKMGYVHQPGILCPVTQRVCTELNISGMPPEYLPLSGPVPALRQRAESCLVQLLQRSCNAPLVVSGGDRRQGRCNDPHKSSIEVHSSREGSRPAASRNG